MAEITLDLNLFGALACYANCDTAGYACLKYRLPEKSTIKNLLAELKMPTEARGITFINGNLSALPGLQPDLDHILHDGDRVAFFDLKSMWPFQYRQGAKMLDELSLEVNADENKGLHHSYEQKSEA